MEVACQALDVVLRVGGACPRGCARPCRAEDRACPGAAGGTSPWQAASSCAARSSGRASSAGRYRGLCRSGPGSRQPRPRLLKAVETVRPGWLPTPSSHPGSARALSRSLTADERGLVIGRRAHAAMGTSACRRAMLPAAAAYELVEAASVAGEPVSRSPSRADGRSGWSMHRT